MYFKLYKKKKKKILDTLTCHWATCHFLIIIFLLFWNVNVHVSSLSWCSGRCFEWNRRAVRDQWSLVSGCPGAALRGIWCPKTLPRSWPCSRPVRRNGVHPWAGLSAGSRAVNARGVSVMGIAGQEVHVDRLERALQPNRFMPVVTLKVSKNSLLASNAVYL